MTIYVKPHRLLAHRGLWGKKNEQNSEESFESALKLGFGIETDLRDQSEFIYISHDPIDRPRYGFDQFVDLVNGAVESGNVNGPMALNVKSDGLLELLQEANELKFQHFYFDMSVPQMLQYFSSRKPLAARWSELEKPSSLLPKIDTEFVWVDSFFSDWVLDVPSSALKLDKEKKYIFVSPELHGRDPRDFWEWFVRQQLEHENIFLCTDFPLRLAGF